MPFVDSLKSELVSLLDNYQKYFAKTYAAAMTFVVLIFVSIAILVRSDTTEQDLHVNNILSLVFGRHSFLHYQLVDFSGGFFFFFLALFSILMLSVDEENGGQPGEFSFIQLMDRITFENLAGLCSTLAIVLALDFILYHIDHFLSYNSTKEISRYLDIQLFHLRLYVAPFLFTLAIFRLVRGPLKLMVKSVLPVLLLLWMFNELAYLFFIWVKDVVIDFLMLGVAHSDLIIFYQSLLCIPVIAALFIGYYSVMTSPLGIITSAPPENILAPEPG